MTQAPASPPPTASSPSARPLTARLTGHNGSRLLITLLAGWIILCSFIAHIAAWVGATVDVTSDAWTPWTSAALAQLLLIGLPTLLLAWRWRLPRYRAIFQAWAWAMGYILLLAPTRSFAPVHGQLITLLQLALTLLYALFVGWIARRGQHEHAPLRLHAIALAMAVGAILTLPWLNNGAFGSLLDVGLNLMLAGAFGILTANILAATWWAALRRDPRQPRRDRLIGGLVMGITLLLLASALSHNGVQLLLMVALPAAAWVILATGTPALALALVVAIPLLLIDADTVALGAMDPLLLTYWSAAALATLAGWLLSALSLIPQPALYQFTPRPIALALGLIAVVVAGFVYNVASYPGLYGDRLLVIMAEQADVSAAADEPDLLARRQQVYSTLVAHADSTQAALRGTLDDRGIAYTPYYLLNALEVQGGLPLRLWLASRADVDRVLISPILRPTGIAPPDDDLATTPPDTPAWNLTRIGADRVWDELGVTGEGIVIGQSDSGVQPDHPELAASYRGATTGSDYNWLDPWTGSAAPFDQSGHGTHTLGSVLGENVGVAPGATWFACANLVRNLGNAAKYLDCMQFMLAPYALAGDPLRDGDPSRAAHVLNNSWGCPATFEGCDPAALEPAVAALRAAGIFVVASAGNDGPTCGTISDPIALYDAAISVGAIDANGNLAPFSSTGPVPNHLSARTKPEIVAPGVDILSAWPGSSYNSISGTSMAGPHVAGVVALMWSANPALIGDIARTEELLLQSARPFTGTLGSGLTAQEMETFGTENRLLNALTGADASDNSTACLNRTDLGERPNIVAGYGIVDAFAAVEAALAAGE